MYFSYLKIKCERSGTYEYFIFKVTAFRVERREQVSRLFTFNRVFLNTDFSTPLAVVELKQFQSDRLKF